MLAEWRLTPRDADLPVPAAPFTSRAYAGPWRVAAWGPAPLGVDLAAAPPPLAYQAVIAEYYHAAEQAAFRELASGAHAHAFLASWTVKEAWCKTRGLGIAQGLPGPDLSRWVALGCPPQCWRQAEFCFEHRHDAKTQHLFLSLVSAAGP